MLDFMDYNSENGIWGKDYVKQSLKLVSPIDWWKGNFPNTLLCKIALVVLNLPCSTAATERSFKTYSWIHCSKRNRLHNIRTAKLVYISHNIKLFNYSQRRLKKRVVKEDTFSASSNESESDDCEEESQEIEELSVPASLSFNDLACEI